MMYTDDPVCDFERYDAQKQEELDELPVCSCCGEPITQDVAIYYNDQWICRDCESDFWQDIRSDFLESVAADA